MISSNPTKKVVYQVYPIYHQMDFGTYTVPNNSELLSSLFCHPPYQMSQIVSMVLSIKTMCLPAKRSFACMVVCTVPSHCQDEDLQDVCPCTDTGLCAVK